MARARKIFPNSVPLDDPVAEAARRELLAEQWIEVGHYDRLVWYFVHRCPPDSFLVLEEKDLMSAGRMGVLRAIQLRDPRMNSHQWRMYITHWIRRSIAESLSDQAAPIRLPPRSVLRRLERDLPGSGALRDARMVLNRFPVVYDPREIVDDVPEGAPHPDEITKIRECVSRLPDRQRSTIESLYGIGCDPIEVKEIAERTGATRQAIRDRRRVALMRLKATLEAKESVRSERAEGSYPRGASFSREARACTSGASCSHRFGT